MNYRPVWGVRKQRAEQVKHMPHMFFWEVPFLWQCKYYCSVIIVSLHNISFSWKTTVVEWIMAGRIMATNDKYSKKYSKLQQRCSCTLRPVRKDEKQQWRVKSWCHSSTGASPANTLWGRGELTWTFLSGLRCGRQPVGRLGGQKREGWEIRMFLLFFVDSLELPLCLYRSPLPPDQSSGPSSTQNWVIY